MTNITSFSIHEECTSFQDCMLWQILKALVLFLLLSTLDELHGDFEDLETGEKFTGESAIDGEEEDDDNDNDDNDGKDTGDNDNPNDEEGMLLYTIYNCIGI